MARNMDNVAGGAHLALDLQRHDQLGWEVRTCTLPVVHMRLTSGPGALNIYPASFSELHGTHLERVSAPGASLH